MGEAPLECLSPEASLTVQKPFQEKRAISKSAHNCETNFCRHITPRDDCLIQKVISNIAINDDVSENISNYETLCNRAREEQRQSRMIGTTMGNNPPGPGEEGRQQGLGERRGIRVSGMVMGPADAIK